MRGGVAQNCRKLRAKFCAKLLVSCFVNITRRVRQIVVILSQIGTSISENVMQRALFQCPLLEMSEHTRAVLEFHGIFWNLSIVIQEVFPLFPSKAGLINNDFDPCQVPGKLPQIYVQCCFPPKRTRKLPIRWSPP